MEQNNDIMIRVDGLKKQYRLGQIGGGTLRGDLQSWWARKRGKEDPNTKIGTDQRLVGQKFMALNGVSFTVKKGEAVGIIGSNGAGKSTLLKLLTHVTAPTEGTIDLYGRVASMLEVGTGFHPEMTGRENVYLNGAILGMTKEEIDAKMEDIIEFSEVRDFIDTPVKRYSSGMYVKLAFSVAAHLDSEIMIMDEVLAVGDMKFQQKCLTKMKEAAKQDGRTVLYVSHNMNTIRQLCDRCIVLNQGKIVFEGDVEKAIAIYSGTETNIFPVTYNMTDIARPSADHGTRLHITNFSFLGKERAIFSRDEAIHFQIDYHAISTLENLCLFLTITNANGHPVGTTQTFKPFLSVAKAGHSYSSEFVLDLSNLCEGDYNFIPDIFVCYGLEVQQSVDHPMQAVHFHLQELAPHGLRWHASAHGNVMLYDVSCESSIEKNHNTNIERN